MWILKNSKDLLDNLKSRSFSFVEQVDDPDMYLSLYGAMNRNLVGIIYGMSSMKIAHFVLIG
jgi:hypothetical protein